MRTLSLVPVVLVAFLPACGEIPDTGEDTLTEVSALTTTIVRTSEFYGQLPVGNDVLRVNATIEYKPNQEVFATDDPAGICTAFPVRLGLRATNGAGNVVYQFDKDVDWCTTGSVFIDSSFQGTLGGVAFNASFYGSVVLSGSSANVTEEGQNVFLAGWDPGALTLQNIVIGGLKGSVKQLQLTKSKSTTTTAPDDTYIPSNASRTANFGGDLVIAGKPLHVSATLRYREEFEVYHQGTVNFPIDFPVDVAIEAADPQGNVLAKRHELVDAAATPTAGAKQTSTTNELDAIDLNTSSLKFSFAGKTVEIGFYDNLRLDSDGSLTVTKRDDGKNLYASGWDPSSLTVPFISVAAPGAQASFLPELALTRKN